VSDATTAAERACAMAHCGIDHSALSDYRRIVAEHDSRDRAEREPLTARRLNGGGRKRVLSDANEAQLEQWIVSKREGPDRERVTEKQVKVHARGQYQIRASIKWMAGLMRQGRLTVSEPACACSRLALYIHGGDVRTMLVRCGGGPAQAAAAEMRHAA